MLTSERIVRMLQWPIFVMALLIIPVLVLEDRATDPQVRAFAHAANLSAIEAKLDRLLSREK